MKRITVSMLQKLEACKNQIKLFEKTWPQGITIPTIQKAFRLGLDMEWLVKRVVPYPLQSEYQRQTASLASLLAEYEQQDALLWAEYQQRKAPLLAEYERRKASLHENLPPRRLLHFCLGRLPFCGSIDAQQAEYERQDALLWAEYKRQKTPLYAEYERQRALLYAEYERQTAPLLASSLQTAVEKMSESETVEISETLLQKEDEWSKEAEEQLRQLQRKLDSLDEER